MEDLSSAPRASIARLVFVPALITLLVTILRLVGELQHWPKPFFDSRPGGGGAIVGIVWLAPIFGIYFAMKLARSGERPTTKWRPIVYAILGAGVMMAGVFVAYGDAFAFRGKMAVGYLIMALAAIMQITVWPALGKSLLLYACAARVPVVVVMFFAFRGHWGTHYDALPPGYPPDTALWIKYLDVALGPQLVFWVVFTVIVGALFGSIAYAFMRSRPATP